MGTGKYRITKIGRNWKENENKNKKKITLKRIVRKGKIKYIDENNDENIDITDAYYKILSSNRFPGTKEQFIFKVNKMERNIENDCVIIKNYTEEEYEKFKENNNKISIKSIVVKEHGKKVNKNKICRPFYEKEKEIMSKRMKESQKFNNIVYNICKKIYYLKYGDNSDKKIYKIFQNKIKVKDVKNLKEAFKQQEKGLETDKLLAISFNKKRNNALLEFIQQIVKQKFENEKELENWFSHSGEKYCKEIFKIYSNMSQKEKYSKLLGHRNKSFASISEKKETLQRRLKLGNYSNYNLRKYYQKDYKEEAIKELKDKSKEKLEKEIEEIIKENYKIDKLCEEISNLEFSFAESKKENKDKMSEIIVKIKEHYKNNVNVEEELENKEKYILSMIHNYIKGRYRKCLELQQKENVDFENLEKRIKEIFDSNEVTKKLKKLILNKVNNYKIFETKFQNPNIESSDDLEILKAEETFLNKLSTAVSKVGYTLNILLEVSSEKDILENYDRVGELCNNNSTTEIYKVYPELEKNEKLLQGMIHFIQGLRQQSLHPKISWNFETKNLKPERLERLKEKKNIKMRDCVVHEDNLDKKEKNEVEIKKYFEKIEEKLPDYFIEKYESNNVFNIYRDFVNKIMELVKKFNFKKDNTIDYLFPKFHKIYKKMCKLENITCKSENIDDRQNGARKYLLQTIYYYYFQYEIENNKNDISGYLNLYRNKIKIEKNSYSYIIDNIDVNNKNIEILYRNIQRKGMLINRLSQMNNEWIEFIAIQFREFISTKELNWILNDLSEYKKKEKLDNSELREMLKLKMNKKLIYSNDSYVFISLSQFLDLREISNLIHDIKKFIQFREKNISKYKPEKNKLYIEELRKILHISKIMLEHKERIIQKHYLERYDEDISIMYGKNIKKKDIKDIEIKIKNENQEIINQSLYKSGNDENNSWIVLYGVEQAKRNGTFKFFKGFFNLNDNIKLCKEDIQEYENLYNEKEENQREVDKYISFEKNSNVDIEEIKRINNNKQLFYYYKNMIYGDGLKKGYDFINDIYSHYLSWAYRIERDYSIYKVGAYNGKIKNFRKEIAHFNYFQKTDKSLLELLNDFYDIFDYNLKYQRDVQKVINNIFEKYQVIREDGGPVIFYCKIDKKLKLSENIIPKKHSKYPEIKLIHEKYVEFFKKLFEYKK